MIEPVTFNVPQLNSQGQRKAEEISVLFTATLKTLHGLIGGDTRDFVICTTKLEEAWLYANKAITTVGQNRVAA